MRLTLNGWWTIRPSVPAFGVRIPLGSWSGRIRVSRQLAPCARFRTGPFEWIVRYEGRAASVEALVGGAPIWSGSLGPDSGEQAVRASLGGARLEAVLRLSDS